MECLAAGGASARGAGLEPMLTAIGRKRNPVTTSAAVIFSRVALDRRLEILRRNDTSCCLAFRGELYAFAGIVDGSQFAGLASYRTRQPPRPFLPAIRESVSPDFTV